jgi:hypothetical protein
MTATATRRVARPKTDEAAARQIMTALLAAGYVLALVDDGEERIPVANADEAWEAIDAVEAATLHVTHPTEGRSWLYFVLGNDPDEVLCDHGESLSPVIDPVTHAWWGWND